MNIIIDLLLGKYYLDITLHYPLRHREYAQFFQQYYVDEHIIVSWEWLWGVDRAVRISE